MITTKTPCNNASRFIYDFHAEVKTYLAPEISETIVDDEGIEHYILVNGNTFPKLKYDSLWLPAKQKWDKKFINKDLGHKRKQ